MNWIYRQYRTHKEAINTSVNVAMFAATIMVYLLATDQNDEAVNANILAKEANELTQKTIRNAIIDGVKRDSLELAKFDQQTNLAASQIKERHATSCAS